MEAKQRTGVLCVFLAAVLYSIGGLCIKVIPWNGLSINGARNLVALLVVGGYLVLSRHRLKLNRWVLLGAVSVCGTNALYAVANKLTTAANASMEPVHDRMPLVLRDGQWETWLRDADSTARLLTTPPPALEAAEEDGQLCLW